MRTHFLLTVALLCSSATAAPVPKELKKQGSIVGRWNLESRTIRGRPFSLDDDVQPYWTIDEKFALTSGDKKGPSGVTQLKIDTATKELDWPTAASSLLGRYDVCEGRLTICLSEANLPRPTTLEPNENFLVYVLRRAEK